MNTIDEKHILISFPIISVRKPKLIYFFDFFDQPKFQLLNTHSLMNDNQIEKPKHHHHRQQKQQQQQKMEIRPFVWRQLIIRNRTKHM